MNIFFTADTHFGHDNAHGGIVNMCQRPFATVEEMDAMQIERWNARVKRNDTVYILGDFAWRRHNSYLAQLNGEKHLIIGNHDKMNQETLRNFTAVYGCLPGGMKGLTIGGRYMVLCHYPLFTWNGRCHKALHLYGQVHGRLQAHRLINTLDVGVDCPYANYAPIEFEEALTLNASLPSVPFDQFVQAAATYCDPDNGCPL